MENQVVFPAIRMNGTFPCLIMQGSCTEMFSCWAEELRDVTNTIEVTNTVRISKGLSFSLCGF